jgi:hypothetical protein
VEVKQHSLEQLIDQIRNQKKKYLEARENGSTAYQNIWDAAKAFLRGKIIAVNTFLKNKRLK